MSAAAAIQIDEPLPRDPLDADLTAAERSFLEGIAATTEDMERAGMFAWSEERRALYGDDPMREIDDLEAGRHPLLARR